MNFKEEKTANHHQHFSSNKKTQIPFVRKENVEITETLQEKSITGKNFVESPERGM